MPAYIATKSLQTIMHINGIKKNLIQRQYFAAVVNRNYPLMNILIAIINVQIVRSILILNAATIIIIILKGNSKKVFRRYFSIPHQSLHHLSQPSICHKVFFKVKIKRNRRIQACTAHYRCIEFIKTMLANPCSNLAANTAGK